MAKARFLDSSVFIHAYLRPRRELTKAEEEVKRRAKEIILRVEEGEPVVTTAVHLSEIVNIVESRLGLLESLQLAAAILSAENIEVIGVGRGDYEAALPVAYSYGVSLNDALAYIKMKEKGVREVYSFDKHFRNFRDVTVLP